MHLAANVQNVCNVRTMSMHNSVGCVWNRWWRQWDGHHVTHMCHLSETGSQYVRFFEIVGSERRFNNIFWRLRGNQFPDFLRETGKSIRFFRPYNQIYFSTNWRIWLPDVFFECRPPAHEQGILAGCSELE